MCSRSLRQGSAAHRRHSHRPRRRARSSLLARSTPGQGSDASQTFVRQSRRFVDRNAIDVSRVSFFVAFGQNSTGSRSANPAGGGREARRGRMPSTGAAPRVQLGGLERYAGPLQQPAKRVGGGGPAPQGTIEGGRGTA